MPKLLLVLLIIVTYSGFSQDKYWVVFTDKENTEFNPYEYFHAKAIERRLKLGYSLYHQTDFPLNETYVSKIGEIVNEIGNSSRWLNAISVKATQEQLKYIKELVFVKSIQPICLQAYPAETNLYYDLSKNKTDLLKKQIEHLEGELFISRGINGKGVRIAIFDGGFPTVDVNPVFREIVKDGRIVNTWDFVKEKENVFDFFAHGTMVMSCIGGKSDSLFLGLASGAEYLLARTEVITEPFVEEENWLAAAEWADKNGADIINSSLGYTYQRYFVDEMDGKTSFVVKAANMAASKGILVINSNGNDGSNRWKYVGTPADADSVLSVGAIDPFTLYHANFSSFGPTADKRLKPNVVAFGNVIAAGKNGLRQAQGTSFSSPLVAGFAACVWQLNPDLSNMEVFEEICKSANLYPYYDYAHGYGIPQASYFLSDSIVEPLKTFSLNILDDAFEVIIFKDFIDDNETDYLYYHIENSLGQIRNYAVIQVETLNAITLPLNDIKKGDNLKVHYKGFTDYYLLK